MALPDARKVASMVFDAELRNIADGGHLFSEYFMLLGPARWIGEAAGAQKASCYLAQYSAAHSSLVFLLGADSDWLNIMASS
jgi:hypothetical protein